VFNDKMSRSTLEAALMNFSEHRLALDHTLLPIARNKISHCLHNTIAVCSQDLKNYKKKKAYTNHIDNVPTL
jgi:hypothetical protein